MKLLPSVNAWPKLKWLTSCCMFEGHSSEGHWSGAQVGNLEKSHTQPEAESCQAKSSSLQPGTLSLRLTVVLWGLRGTWGAKGRTTVTGVQVGVYKVWITLGYSFWVISPLAYFYWLWVLLPFRYGLNCAPTPPHSPAEILTPNTSGCDLTSFFFFFCRCNPDVIQLRWGH